MSQRPHTATERPNAGAFLVRDGAVIAGRDPILCFLEIQTETGSPFFDLLRVFDPRRTSELADGWYQFHPDGITRRVVPDAIGKADFFPDCERP